FRRGALEREQHAAQRVVGLRVVEVLELPAHTGPHDGQVNELEQEREDAERADDDDDVTDFLAELDALAERGTLDVQLEQHAARGVDDGRRIAARRALEALENLVKLFR